MKQSFMALTLALALMFVGCGSGTSSSNNVSGNWSANLTGTNGSPSFAFTMTLFQNSDNTVSVSNLTFTTATPCFTQGQTRASGAFALNQNFSGTTNGSLTLVIQSTSGNGSTLDLQATVVGNGADGTWTLKGADSDCNGSGNLTMSR